MSEDEVCSYIFRLCVKRARESVHCYIPGLKGIVRKLMEESSKEDE